MLVLRRFHILLLLRADRGVAVGEDGEHDGPRARRIMDGLFDGLRDVREKAPRIREMLFVERSHERGQVQREKLE